MPDVEIDFDAPDLSARIEKLSLAQLDTLSFGVVRLDREGVIVVYSATEARQSGYGSQPLGENFYEIARCAGKNDFHGKIIRAQEDGKVDLEFAWPGDYDDPKREVRVRVQSARQGGVWMFMQRD
jgi:photoactive yellow protein